MIQQQAFGYVARTSQRHRSGLLESRPASYRRQQDSARDWCAAHGFLAKWFRDKDIDTPLDKRPGFTALIAALPTSDVRTVLIYSAAVFSSDPYFQGMVVRCFETQQINLIELNPPKDKNPLRDQGSALVRAFEPLVRFMKSRRRGTIRSGRKPYGTRSNESRIVDLIRSLHSSGNSHREIANTLNDLFVEPRTRGAKWHAFTISRILGRQLQDTT